MKRAFAILGAALLVALGLFLPRLAAAYQERGLAADVRRMENAAVSLTLAQELVELTELDLFQSLELFSSHVTMVELEEGQHTSAEDAMRTAVELALNIPADVYLEGDKATPDLAVPFLLTNEYGRSGIFWRCGWEDRPDEAVWIDDQNQSLAGFCLCVSTISVMDGVLAEDLCQAICDRFFPPNVDADVFRADDGGLAIYMEQGEDAVYIPVDHAGPYLYFNSNGDLNTEATSILP